MKEILQEILDSLDEKPPRSRLMPYREFIIELRRRKYTYRDIRQILWEKCQLQVSISTLHSYLRVQKNPKRISRTDVVSGQPKPQRKKAPEKIPISALSKKNKPAKPFIEARQRIAAFKQQPAKNESEVTLFKFDPDKPLHLVVEN